jgi:hypothetical protein
MVPVRECKMPTLIVSPPPPPAVPPSLPPELEVPAGPLRTLAVEVPLLHPVERTGKRANNMTPSRRAAWLAVLNQ